MFEIHPARYISEKSESISVTSSPNDGRRPKPRPDFYGSENPDRLFLASNDGFDLVCLEFRNGESRYFSVVELTTTVCCLFEPAGNRIPGYPLYPGDCGLIQTLNTKGGRFIEGRATMLETMVRCTGIRAERFAASPASIATTPPPPGLVEAVANDVFGTDSLKHRALPVPTAETLHGFWIQSTVDLIF